MFFFCQYRVSVYGVCFIFSHITQHCYYYYYDSEFAKCLPDGVSIIIMGVFVGFKGKINYHFLGKFCSFGATLKLLSFKLNKVKLADGVTLTQR